MIDAVSRVIGEPVVFETLKERPGRRRTLRAAGQRGSVIVKVYASDRVAVVADRLAELAGGPAEPRVPAVLAVDPAAHFIVLSDLAGVPLREAVVAGDLATCRRAGAAVAAWHGYWRDRRPAALTEHTVERETAILEQRAGAASAPIARAVTGQLRDLGAPWACSTVIHRDLYEEQVLVDDTIGLIDLDDAALGPSELDLGNLVAHVELLGLRRGVATTAQAGALIDGYRSASRPIDGQLLERCRALSLLRLACLNDDIRLVEMALAQDVAA